MVSRNTGYRSCFRVSLRVVINQCVTQYKTLSTINIIPTSHIAQISALKLEKTTRDLALASTTSKMAMMVMVMVMVIVMGSTTLRMASTKEFGSSCRP